MNSSRKGMASVESLLLIAVGALILMGITQYWETNLAPQVKKTIAIVIGQEEELESSKPVFQVNRPKQPEKVDPNETFESKIWREFHAVADVIRDLESRESLSAVDLAVLEQLRNRYDELDRLTTRLDRVDPVFGTDAEYASLLLDFAPVVSQIKAAYELGTGNSIYGKELTKEERRLAALGLVPWGKLLSKSKGLAKVVGIVPKRVFAKAGDLARRGKVDPKTIRFSQDSISGTFKNGDSVTDLASKLKNGTVDPSSIPPIRVVERNGKIFTLDNRRLRAFQEAGIDIPFEKLDSIPKRDLFKFTTKNDGIDINIRGK